MSANPELRRRAGSPVSFDGSGSNGSGLRRRAGEPNSWDFGDGSPAVETTTPSASHTYEQAGYAHGHADGAGHEEAPRTPRRVRIYAGNGPPEPTISSPAQDKLFAVGEKIELRGSATDPQDGELPDSALSWEVVQHHNGDHTHPPLRRNRQRPLHSPQPTPEDLLSTGPEENYLEIRLTATDSQGLSKTVAQKLTPKTVDVTFESKPSGLKLRPERHHVPQRRGLSSRGRGYKLRSDRAVAADAPQVARARSTPRPTARRRTTT